MTTPRGVVALGLILALSVAGLGVLSKLHPPPTACYNVR